LAATKTRFTPRLRTVLFLLGAGITALWVSERYGLRSVDWLPLLSALVAGLIAPRLVDHQDKPSRGRLALALGLCVAVALYLRLTYFNGIGGHGDFAYLYYLRRMFHGDFVEVFTTSYGHKVLVIAPMLLLFKLFGPSYLTAFAPVMVLSIAQIFLAYAIVRRLGLLPPTALTAVWLVAVYPLDVFVASTIRGDIETGFIFGLCSYLLLRSGLFGDAQDDRRSAGWAVALGFCLGLGTLIKATCWTGFFIVFLFFLAQSLRMKKPALRFGWVAAGVALFFVAQAVFFQLAVGDALQSWRIGLLHLTRLEAQGDFANDPSLRFSFMPAMLFDWKSLAPRLADWDSNNYGGYGMYFYLLAFALLLYTRRLVRDSAAALIWVGGFILFFTFGSMSLFHYTPPHKQIRHLSAVTVPLTILVAVGFHTTLHAWFTHKLQKWMHLALIAGVAVSSVAVVSHHHRQYRQIMPHKQALLKYVNEHPDRHLWLPHTYMQHLELKTGYAHPKFKHNFPGWPDRGHHNDLNFFEADAFDEHYVVLDKSIADHRFAPSPVKNLQEMLAQEAYEVVDTIGEGSRPLTVLRVLPEKLAAPTQTSVAGDVVWRTEAEQMNFAGDVAALVQDMSSFDGEWSGKRQLLVDAEAAGVIVDLTFTITEPVRGTLQVRLTRAADYGVVDFALDGETIGSPLDAYAPSVQPSDFLTLGEVDLASGVHRLTVACRRKNPVSNGAKFGLDVFVIRR